MHSARPQSFFDGQTAYGEQKYGFLFCVNTKTARQYICKPHLRGKHPCHFLYAFHKAELCLVRRLCFVEIRQAALAINKMLQGEKTGGCSIPFGIFQEDTYKNEMPLIIRFLFTHLPFSFCCRSAAVLLRALNKQTNKQTNKQMIPLRGPLTDVVGSSKCR